MPRIALALILAGLALGPIGCSDDTATPPQSPGHGPADSDQGTPKAASPDNATGSADSSVPTRRAADPDLPALPEPTLPFGQAGQTRVAEPRSELYPQQDKWALAGAGGGIPAPAKPSVTVDAGGDIQQAIDATQAGTVALSAGTYELAKPLKLKSNVVVRGADAGTEIRFGAGGPVAIDMQGLSKAGLANVTLVYTDPDKLTGPQTDAGVYANAPDFEPTDKAAVQIADSRDCWLDGVTVVNALANPLSVNGSSHCTLRSVTIDGVVNRGNGAGQVTLANADQLLLIGWRVQGLRKIAVDGPVTWSVIRGAVLGCGLDFADSDKVAGLLLEDVHFLLPPGHPFMALSKGPFPMGPDNFMINCTMYHQGTDAISRQIMEPGVAYQIQPYAYRVGYAPETDQGVGVRFITPYATSVAKSGRADWNATVKLEPTWKQAPQGTDPIHLQSGRLLDDWYWAGSLGPDALKLDVAPLVGEPLQPGQTRTLAGKKLEVGHFQPKPHNWEASNPANTQAMVGRFGIMAVPAGGAAVNLLQATGGDWKGGAVLQRVIELPGEAMLTVSVGGMGAQARVFLGTTELNERTPYLLKPGAYPLTVLAKLRKPPFGKMDAAPLELKFSLIGTGGELTEMRPVRPPLNGFLYPYVGLDPLADERAGLAAWERFRSKDLREVPLADGPAKARALAAKHEGTYGAYLLGKVADVLADAPYEESDSLTKLQWGEQADYYHRRGLIERKWYINREMKPEKFRQFYPDVEANR